MSTFLPGKPGVGEYAEFYAKYVNAAGAFDQPVDRLAEQLEDVLNFFRAVDPAKRKYRYAEGKWSIQDLVQHMTDTERVFSYRALRVGRGDTTSLPGFDENAFAANADADNAEWDDLVQEFSLVRQATMALFAHLPEAAWQRIGTASNHPVSTRALAWIMVGHVEHHLEILRERYL